MLAAYSPAKAQNMMTQDSAKQRRLRGVQLRLGRGAEACVEWKQELAAGPARHDACFGYAELCLFLGDEAEYRRARSDLLARFGNVTDRSIAERVGRACLLLSAPADELRQAAALIERAVAGGRVGHELAYPYFLFALGLARYRQGRFDEGIELMTGEAAAVLGPCPRLVLAMAQHQKGQHDLARQTLVAAVSSHDWRTDRADNHDAWIAHILRRQAENLIATKAGDNDGMASSRPGSDWIAESGSLLELISISSWTQRFSLPTPR
jgi:serine/threonine-protein kinase